MNIAHHGKEDGELTGYLTMREVLALNPKSNPDDKNQRRKMLRQLKRRQEDLGVTLLFRKGQGPKSEYVTTEPLLKQHCRELVNYIPTAERNLGRFPKRVEELTRAVEELQAKGEGYSGKIERQRWWLHDAFGRLAEAQQRLIEEQQRRLDGQEERISRLESIFLRKGNHDESSQKANGHSANESPQMSPDD
jgi:predicted RNase H-like nuclease (RuvC/YqgF family)